MSFSFGAIVTCFLICFILTIYVSLILKVQNNIFMYGIKIVFVGMIFIIFRTMLPLNFPFTITLPVDGFFAQTSYFFYNKNVLGMSIISILTTLWITGIVINFILNFIKNIQTRRTLHQCSALYESTWKKGTEVLSSLGYSNFTLAVVPNVGSPFITGLIKPTIVLPDCDIPEHYLKYILLHETEHYRNFDLWIKLLLEVIVCIYWWNPLVYQLRTKMQLAMEISNDMVVIKQFDHHAKLDYASFLIHMSKLYSEKNSSLFANLSIPLIRSKSDLEVRTMKIVNGAVKHTPNLKPSFYTNLILVMFIVLFSYTFVFEAAHVPAHIENSSFSIPEDTSYFIETEQGFDLYIDGEYKTTVDEISPSLDFLKIIQEEP